MGTAKDLKALPVLPGNTTDRVKEAYVAELRLVTDVEMLGMFLHRWRPLYLLTKKQAFNRKAKNAKRYRFSENNLVRLIRGEAPLKEVLECVQLNRTDQGCKHIRQYSCPGAHVLVPPILMQVDWVSRHYGISTDLALVQMNGGWGPYEAETGVTE